MGGCKVKENNRQERGRKLELSYSEDMCEGKMSLGVMCM